MVRHLVADLKTRLATGPDRKNKGVVAFFGQRHGGRLYRHTAGTLRSRTFNDGTLRQAKLKGMVAKLGAWRRRFILEKEVFDNFQALVVRITLQADHIGVERNARNLGRCIEDIDLERLRSRRRCLEVVRLVVRNANKMNAFVRNIQRKAAVRVRLCLGRFLHALRQPDEGDVVAGGRLLDCLVRDHAGDRGRRKGGERQQESQSKGATHRAEGQSHTPPD